MPINGSMSNQLCPRALFVLGRMKCGKSDATSIYHYILVVQTLSLFVSTEQRIKRICFLYSLSRWNSPLFKDRLLWVVAMWTPTTVVLRTLPCPWKRCLKYSSKHCHHHYRHFILVKFISSADPTHFRMEIRTCNELVYAEPHSASILSEWLLTIRLQGAGV